jgi:glycosyltransferase involved in cell wall biosynthesis
MSKAWVVVLIPAYNAAETISELISKLRDYLSESQVIVIDDGSVDDTASLALEAGACLIQHPANRGKGAALKSGFAMASHEGYDYVLTLDADLQHSPECVPLFLELADSFQYDMVIGVRERTEIMPSHRVFANFMTSVLISMLAGVRIRDSQSGFRLISTKLLKSIHLRGDKYDLESEILLRAGLAGFRIGELTIPTVYEGSRSFINPVLDGMRFLKILGQGFFW